MIGTISGVILGITFCINITKIQYFFEIIFNIDLFSPEIYFLTTLPSRINYWEVLFIGLVSLFLTIIATIYPAIKSTRINPIRVIRNE